MTMARKYSPCCCFSSRWHTPVLHFRFSVVEFITFECNRRAVLDGVARRRYLLAPPPASVVQRPPGASLRLLVRHPVGRTRRYACCGQITAAGIMGGVGLPPSLAGSAEVRRVGEGCVLCWRCRGSPNH